MLPTRREPEPNELESLGARILATTLARELIVIRPDGTIATHVTVPGERPMLSFGVGRVRVRDVAWIERIQALVEGIGFNGLVSERIGDRGVILVRFDTRTSRGYVTFMLREFMPELTRAMATAWPEPMMGGGGSGPSGAPAEAAVRAPFPTDRRKLN